MIEFYNTDQVNNFINCKSNSGREAVFAALLKVGVIQYLPNLNTEIKVLDVNGRLYLVSIGAEYNSCFLISMYSQFILSSFVVANKIDSLMLRAFVKFLCLFLSPLTKILKINKIVSVNFLPVMIGGYDVHFTDTIDEVTNYLKCYFPDHAIIINHVNERCDSQLIKTLKKLKYQLIQLGSVNIFDKSIYDFTLKKDYKRDSALLEKTRYALVSNDEISHADYGRIIELYNMIYIVKHSPLNIKITKQYLELIHQSSFIKLAGFRNKQGVLDAFIAYYNFDKTQTIPYFGYDVNIDKAVGLRRMISAVSLQRAERRMWQHNAGAGCDHFKLLRGATQFTSYIAIYCNHLSFPRRFLWWCVERVYVPIANYTRGKLSL